MTTILFALVAIILIVQIALFLRLPKEKTGESSEGFVLLQNQLSNLTKSIDTRLSDSASQSMKIVRDITERLTRLDETNKQVISITEELQSLQDILKNPKQRGVLGEYYLETLLKNVMPPGSYQMQYAFPDGTVVDAAVFVDKRIIAVDSKFSLENYRRLAEERDENRRADLEKAFVNDLKQRIAETAKYIKPEDGTMDFAFMFIPHEAIYYDLLVNKVGEITGETENLIERAARKYKVIIVSPTSFLAYLQTVLQGLRALKIEESAKEIRKNVDELRKHLAAYGEYHNKLGNALATTVNHYAKAGGEFKKIDKDVLRITGEKLGIEPKTVDRPLILE
ncbi:MAG TPA: DNA recombination protein RmuC [Candidatus Paceibacterota bacterium]